MHGDWGVTDYRGVNVASNQLNLLNVHFTSPDVSIHLFLEELKFRTFNFAIFLIFTFSHIFFLNFILLLYITIMIKLRKNMIKCKNENTSITRNTTLKTRIK
jgi:hypothetical protein